MRKAEDISAAGRRRLFWETLAVVAAVNLLFLVLFSYAEPAAPPTSDALGQVTLLDLREAYRAEPELPKWLAWHDPGLFVRPDRRVGYSRWGAAEPKREIPPEAAAAHPVPPVLEMESAAFPTTATEPVGDDWSSGITPVRFVELPSFTRATVYPVVLWQGRPSDWQAPAALTAAAVKAHAEESTASFVPIPGGKGWRCSTATTGVADGEWDRKLFLELSASADEVTGGKAGTLRIIWRAPGESGASGEGEAEP